MPNRSDSAGKIHQFYTCKGLKKIDSRILIYSEFINNDEVFAIHTSQFSETELESLRVLGAKSADLIFDEHKNSILEVHDIGVSSGAGFIDKTVDLELKLNARKVEYSLKCQSTPLKQVLSKNMGALSLFESYFNESEAQQIFNAKFNDLHILFLNTISGQPSAKVSDAKKIIRNLASMNGLKKARFEDVLFKEKAEPARNDFLSAVRDLALENLKSFSKISLAKACNLIMDTGKTHILGTWASGKEQAYLRTLPIQEPEDIISVSTRDNRSVLIELRNFLVGFRYKFESGITSSIKLVGDYKHK